MKEVRYNDKMWFGKHKGSRIYEIIKSDPQHIQKLIKDGQIVLDTKSSKFFNDIMFGGRKERQTFNFNPEVENQPMVDTVTAIGYYEDPIVAAHVDFEGSHI